MNLEDIHTSLFIQKKKAKLNGLGKDIRRLKL